MRVIVSVLLMFALFAGMSFTTTAQDRLVVSSSFTIVYDFVQQVGGDRIDHRLIVPLDAEVHEWELLPRNFVDLEETAVFFYNGLRLEEWVPQAEAILDPRSLLVPLGEVFDVDYLRIAIGEQQGDLDPHVWMNPIHVIAYVDVIADVLSEMDPEHEAYYRSNAEGYQNELRALDADLHEIFGAIPEQQKILITSEAAFLYFSAAYGFVHDGIWGTNAEEEGTPQQIVRILNVIEEYEPAAIFWESTISDRYVQAVADDTGLPVQGPLYVDSLSSPGTSGDSYLNFMRHNANLIVTALGL